MIFMTGICEDWLQDAGCMLQGVSNFINLQSLTRIVLLKE